MLISKILPATHR